MEIAVSQKSPKRVKKNICEICDYKCNKYSDFNKHLLTSKHKNNMNGNNKEIKKIERKYNCNNCNKEYKTNSGLWKHQNKCIQKVNYNTNVESTAKNKTKINKKINKK
jgi:Zn finger protein HypA/HybF involved in hydrogenase expression